MDKGLTSSFSFYFPLSHTQTHTNTAQHPCFHKQIKSDIVLTCLSPGVGYALSGSGGRADPAVLSVFNYFATIYWPSQVPQFILSMHSNKYRLLQTTTHCNMVNTQYWCLHCCS